jgi:hypothetical protein
MLFLWDFLLWKEIERKYILSLWVRRAFSAIIYWRKYILLYLINPHTVLLVVRQWWRQLARMKRRSNSTRLHGAISHKAVIFILATVRTLNLTNISVSCGWRRLLFHIETVTYMLNKQSRTAKKGQHCSLEVSGSLIIPNNRLRHGWIVCQDLFTR